MKRPKVLDVLITVLFVVGFTLLMWGLSMCVVNKYRDYSSRLRGSRLSLHFTRNSIRLFFEQNGTFPKSLQELNEYGKNFPKEIKWMFPPENPLAATPQISLNTLF